MKIGLAKTVITPKFPALLAGFAAQRLAEEKLDDLFVKVIIVKTEEETYGIVNYDLIGFDHLLMDRLRTRFRKIGLDIEHFLLSATHTHSGPGGVLETRTGILKGTEYFMMPTDEKIIGQIEDRTIEAVQNAVDDCKEGKIRTEFGSLEGIGNNRNDRTLKGCNDLYVVEFSQTEGQKAVAVNFACHPTVLNLYSKKISADFPGAVDQLLGEKNYLFSAFLNGSCGDISTRFSRQGNGYEEVMRYGTLLADKVYSLLEYAKKAEIHSITEKSYQMMLKLKEKADIEEAQRKVTLFENQVRELKEQGITGTKLRLAESFYEGACVSLSHAENATDETEKLINISIFKVNEQFFVCVPGELFSELSNSVQTERIHFIGYGNGYMGYFADQAAYDNLCYEALSSPFEKGQAEVLMDFIREKINELK